MKYNLLCLMIQFWLLMKKIQMLLAQPFYR